MVFRGDRSAESAAYYAQHRDAILARQRTRRKQRTLERLAAIPMLDLSRRQQMMLLRILSPEEHRMCAWCWVVKGLGAFNKDNSVPDGLSRQCRQCRKEINRGLRYRKKMDYR